MAYAMFRCCVTAKHLPEFDLTTDTLLSRLGIETVEIPEFGCCGYPLKNVAIEAALAAAARNLALAERAGQSILTACACCFGTLKHAARQLDDRALRTKINESLAPEGLRYKGTAVVRHLLHVLREEVGTARIDRLAVAGPGFRRIAIQYGCKLLRPNLSAGLSSANTVSFLEELITAAGATVVPWGLEKDCCGSGIRTTDQALARAISESRMSSAQKAGADGVAAACPFCILQLRRSAPDSGGVDVLAIAQLLCQALGFENKQ